jgi:adenylate cyclase
VPSGAQFTVADVSDRADVSEELIERFARAAGIVEPDLDDIILTEREMELVTFMAPAFDLLGEEAVLQLLRVAAAAISRIGDTTISTFSTGAGARATRDDESGLLLLEANLAAAEMLPQFGDLLTQMLTRYLGQEYRQMNEQSLSVALSAGVDASQMAIGFADLVGSTSLADRGSLAELNSALDAFEQTAADTVRANDGRVVKFIGDEVMFRADSADAGCTIAVDLIETLRSDDLVPPVRVGLAFGDVLTRSGDFYGPTVNLAARLTKLAPMNGVVSTVATVDALSAPNEFVIGNLGAIAVTGLAEPVELANLSSSTTP